MEDYKMDIYKKMWEISTKLEKMRNNDNYDVENFIQQLEFQINQLSFFYDSLVPKQNNDTGKTFFNLKSRPKEHQLIYANLTRGFPKELYDAHYCYLLKDCGCKFIVIPTTSLKLTSPPCNELFELDIDVKYGDRCRLNIDDIRVIDFMRIVEYKGYSDVLTNRKDILSFVNSFFKDKVDTEYNE
jgi:hypothetical protein